jgi:tetratricopeptide (TPR) repeat protein
MAKRRLNKKVALVGSAVFLIFVLVAIVVILRLSQDPEKLVRDGDIAWEAARQATDEEIKEEEYREAERNYGKARGEAQSDSFRVEILLKLVDLYIETDQWRKALGTWNQIILIDPKNVKARFGRLEFYYIMADTGHRAYWQEVESQASDFIDVANDELLAQDTERWEFPFLKESNVVRPNLMGSYLYLRRGRANLEVAKMGAVIDREQALTQAIADMEKVKEFDPENIDVYWLLAQAIIEKGEIAASKGNLEERDEAREQATQILEQAVEVDPDKPKAHINLLTMKLVLAQNISREEILALEPEYLSLTQRFGSAAEAFSTLAGLYLRLGHKYLDKAIEAVEKAVELDPQNVAYARVAANLYYNRFSIYGQREGVYKAIEMAKHALTLPDSQDTPGPRQNANRINRLTLYMFLANCYIEQLLDPYEGMLDSEKQQWMTDAEDAVHQIGQIIGSGEAPMVVKWQGMLELAKGNKNLAVRKLYAAYEQLKAGGQRDGHLAYTLADLFKNTTELGATNEFYASALSLTNRALPDKIDESKPEVLLDYAEVLLKLGNYNGVLSIINFFESEYWSNQKSQSLRIRANISSMQFDEAEQELAKIELDEPNTVSLKLALAWARRGQIQRAIRQKRTEKSSGELLSTDTKQSEDVDELMAAELASYNDVLAEEVTKAMRISPESVGSVYIVAICDNYINQDQIAKAEDLVDQCLRYVPDSATALFFKQLLSEPEPRSVSQQRRIEIEKQVLSNVEDPVQRAIGMGSFYQRNNQLDKAAEEFKKVLEITKGSDRMDDRKIVADFLSNMATVTKNLELAQEIADLGRQENLDECEGNLFAARLEMVKQDYTKALARIDECLKQRPVFSSAYMFRSQINNALGNEHESIEDVRKAASLNPLDGSVVKGLAFALYQRDQKLGDNVSSDQELETRTALDRAVALNSGDLELLSFYAEYIAPAEPDRALAIRQNLQRVKPSLQNAILLGRMATRTAFREYNAERKEALLAIAASSFEQAMAIDPQDKTLLTNFAEYYRLTGQEEKAEQLLAQSENPRLMWAHYYRAGKFADAKEVLEKLYQDEPGDAEIIKGLLLIAETTADQDAVKKYSEELLAIEDNVDNHLYQIQVFLKIGLVKEAEYKLESLKEKYPDEPRSLLLQAWLALKQGQLEKALELTNRNLETDQDNAIAWRLRGEANRFMANYSQAIVDLRRSKSLVSAPATQLSLAKAYLRAGRELEAITELKNTIDNPQAPAEARLMLERIYVQLNRKGDLRDFYNETLNRFPNSVLWHNRAAEFALQEGDYDRAEQLYEQVLQSQEANVDLATVDGYLRTLIQAEKLDKVFEQAQKHINSDLAPVAFLAMAQAKLELQDKATAEEYFRKALDKAGTDQTLISEVLERMHSLLDPEDVLRHCEEKLRKDPDSLTSNFIMFYLMRMNAEYNKAVGYIDKCLAKVGSDDSLMTNYVISKAEVLTLAYEKTSDNSYLKTAIVTYESLLDKMPNNIGVLNNLAYLLAESNDRLAEALEYAQKAHKARPNNPGFLDTYSYVLYKNGRLSEAEEFLQAALQQYEAWNTDVPADVYEHLGMIKEETGERARALDAYKQALEIVSSGELASDVAKERISAAIERLN